MQRQTRIRELVSRIQFSRVLQLNHQLILN